MLIDNIDKKILKNGFIVPKFNDVVKIIWYCDDGLFYRLVILLFYILGCFKVRFFQYDYYFYVTNTVREISFHLVEWNPISSIASIVIGVLNYFCCKDITKIMVSEKIIIDVKNNQAYIADIRK